MFNCRIILFLLTVFCGCYGEVDIKKYLKVCDRNSVDVNDCMVDAIQKGIATMASGIEELKTPGIDPFYQKDYNVEYKNNQIIARMNMKNIYVEGLKTATVHDVRLRADDDRFHLEVDMSNPRVFVKGDYSGGGQFNALKIAATGSFNTTMTDLVWTWKLDGVPEKHDDGEIYIRIKDFYMRPDVGSIISWLSNDNPESKDLINLGIRFANENWRTLYRELLPYAQANWNKQGVKIANKIFLKVPYNQVFPTAS